MSLDYVWQMLMYILNIVTIGEVLFQGNWLPRHLSLSINKKVIWFIELDFPYFNDSGQLNWNQI